MDSFISIDVETASKYERGSICQLSIAEYKNGNIDTIYDSLINPLCELDPTLCHIHGIMPNDIKHAPCFKEAWIEIAPLIKDKKVICHNAIFDISAIEKAMYDNKIDPMEIIYTCSLMASRRAWPGLPTYRLNSLCERFGIEIDHHNAASDARACCELTLRICEEMNASSLEELAWRCGTNLCSSFTNSYDPSDSSRSYPPIETISPEAIPGMPRLEIDCENRDYFKGKYVVFTGQMYCMTRSEAIQLVLSLGALYKGDRITKKTDILIIGKQDMVLTKGKGISTKQLKAIEYRKKGLPIEWIDEGEFLQLVNTAQKYYSESLCSLGDFLDEEATSK